MRILFIDTASTSFPSRAKDGPTWQPHMIRVAAIREDDGEETGRLVALVCPLADWFVDPATEPYHHANIGELAHDSLLIEQVVDRLAPLLDGIDLIVGHHLQFHDRVLRAAFEDAETTLVGDWPLFDTMGGTADIVQVRTTKQGGWKSPTLAEAYAFFEGRDLTHGNGGWRDFATGQVEAVRAVYEGARRHKRLSDVVRLPVVPTEG
jgi:hypothetical protein